MYTEEEDHYKSEFHIPGFDQGQKSDREIVKQVSISEHSPFAYAEKSATSASLGLYEELSAVSEEVLKCRKAAISRVA